MKQYTIVTNSNHFTVSSQIRKSTAVIAHLYYSERFFHSISYLMQVPADIRVFIVTANPDVVRLAQDAIRQNNLPNMEVIEKPNRGRDYGALLVSAREILRNYQFIAFIHDKKSHPGEHHSLGDIWEECLFESILGSRNYIEGVLHQFEEDPTLGLLFAPIPAEEHLLGLAGVLWTENYDATVNLLKRLSVHVIPKKESDPLTIGSAFWFRTEALQKLFAYPWTYEDFPPEPMPNDGTVAHALERAPAYICMDAGYQARCVMNDRFAQAYIAARDEQLTQAMCIIREANLMAFTGDKLDLALALKKLQETN